MEASTTELVGAAAAGDQGAWDRLVSRYEDLLWSVARGHRLDPAEAGDVVQTTWLTLLEALGRVEDPERLAGWLATTARRESVRGTSGREVLDDAPWASLLEPGAELPDDDELLARLPADDPVPAEVSQLAKASFGLRRVDEELADLDEESGAVDGLRRLGFRAGEVVVEVQLCGQDPVLLVGQVAAPGVPAGLVRVQRAELAVASADLDDRGSFRFEDVAPGTVRLVVELAERPPVATPWFST